jgi:hypothetical protein
MGITTYLKVITAYIVLLLPYSVVRLLEISGFSVAFELLIFASVCWFLLGEILQSKPFLLKQCTEKDYES